MYIKQKVESIKPLKLIFGGILLFLVMLISYSNTAKANAQEIMSLIKAAEVRYEIPSGLLGAIAEVESGISPYALNIGGKSLILATKKEA